MTTTNRIISSTPTLPVSNPSLWQRLKNSVFFIKLFNWEYWSLTVANIPLLLIWFWFVLRSGRLFFFTSVNPVIETGGAWGESKIGILRRIPESHLPKTVFVEKGTDFQTVMQLMQAKDLTFPIIAKPDIGERGFLVSKIKNEDGLRNYLKTNPIDFIIQTFIDLPLELAVMHHRLPGEKKGKVTSICIKETLKVNGDGRSSVRELMAAYPRAKLQLARFEKEKPTLLKEVPPNGTTLELEPIGNHCLGTMFLNGNQHIDEAFTSAFDEVAFQMDDIFYGRFDLKCASIEAIKAGQGFQIMEYNGVMAEPAHIYDPAYPFLKKFRDIYRHWKIIYKIHRIQAAKGIQSMTLQEVRASLKKYSDYKKALANGQQPTVNSQQP